jgi:rhamnosyltransferase
MKQETYNVVAVIVTFNPNLELFKEVIASLLPQLSKIYIIDNGSNNLTEIIKFENQKVNVISLKKNMGIAYALNIGVKYCLEENTDWILTLDQDTILFENALKQVFNAYSKSDYTKEDIGIIAINPINPKNDLNKEEFVETNFVITSGNLVNSKVFQKIKYRNDFFIDQVDYEFDLNVLKSGYKILKYTKPLMKHQIGIKDKTGKSFEPIWRVYYITRNSTFLVTRYNFPFKFYFSQLLHLYFRTFYVLGIKSAPKLLFVFIKGLLNGLTGRLTNI